MATMINDLGLVNVKAYTYSLPQFSQRIIVAFASNMLATVTNLVSELDVVGNDDALVTLMIDSSTDPKGNELLNNRIELLTMMMKLDPEVSKAVFRVSNDISKVTNGHLFVLYLENATMAEVQLARDIIEELDVVKPTVIDKSIPGNDNDDNHQGEVILPSDPDESDETTAPGNTGN